MATWPTNIKEIKKSAGVKGWWIFGTILIIVLLCSVISWGLISAFAPAKAAYSTDITKINNTIGHIQDATVGLDRLAGYQNNTTQTQLDDINGEILGINDDLNTNQTDHQAMKSDISGVKTEVTSVKSDLASTASTLTSVKTKVDSLDTSVASLNTKANDSSTGIAAINTKINDSSTGLAAINTRINDSSTGLTALDTRIDGINEGLQITPTITASTAMGGTGNIALAITSGVSQNIALKIEFRPPADSTALPNDAVYETLLKTLYTSATTPVTLRQASSTGTVVRGDYQVYYNNTDTKFHVGSIVFITQAIALTADTAVTKTLYFTYKTGTAPSFDIIITPVIGSVTSTGATPSTW